MIGRNRIVVIVLAALLAACGAERAVPSAAVAPDPTATPTPAVVEPTADPATPDPSPLPTPTTKPSPNPTPVPVPPKPTGLRASERENTACDPSGICYSVGSTFTVTWKAPTAKGVEVRAYGVTTCFRPANGRGACLRTHTALPEDIRVLLARAPASKGRLRVTLGDRYFDTSDGCVVGWRSKDGTSIYSIVVAAYGEGGHSIFAIAEPGLVRRSLFGCDPGTY